MAERPLAAWAKQEIYASLKALRVAGLSPQAVRFGQELLAREFANLGARHADVLTRIAPDARPPEVLQFRLPRDLVSQNWLPQDNPPMEWLDEMQALDRGSLIDGVETARELE
ncbi:hypothetical protein OAI46_04130, partial [Alphaproteobacteria bacterium]|nr:hypothetical protein [Alphaproteobacteria bacterium]